MELLTKDEVYKLIDTEVVNDTDAIQIVRKFIFDKTGKDIKGINRPQGFACIIKGTNLFPDIVTDFDLLFKMYITAIGYYEKEKTNF